MLKYTELKKQHAEEINDLPIFWAFSNEQFNEGLEKLGLKPTDTKQLASIGSGGYAKETDIQIIKDLFKKHPKEFKKAIASDTTGEGFIFDMFDYELSNYEYCVTYDIADTIEALSLTIEEINSNPALLKGLNLAVKKQRDNDN